MSQDSDRLISWVRAQMLRLQHEIRLRGVWIRKQWKHRRRGSVFVTLSCVCTKKTNHKPKEDEDQLVILPLAIQSAACNIFGKCYKDINICTFPFKNNVHLNIKKIEQSTLQDNLFLWRKDKALNTWYYLWIYKSK